MVGLEKIKRVIVVDYAQPIIPLALNVTVLSVLHVVMDGC